MGTTNDSIQPQPQPHVLGSSPLLVFEHEDTDAPLPLEQQQQQRCVGRPDCAGDDDAPCHSLPTGTGKGTGMLIYSLSERSIIYMMTMAATNTWFSTPQGWVLVMGEVSETWLWHPLTGDTIALPPIHDYHCIPVNCKCLLTHASVTHPDCAVVLLDVAHPLMWFCRVNNGGTTDDRQRWGQHTYDIGNYGRV